MIDIRRNTRCGTIEVVKFQSCHLSKLGRDAVVRKASAIHFKDGSHHIGSQIKTDSQVLTPSNACGSASIPSQVNGSSPVPYHRRDSAILGRGSSHDSQLCDSRAVPNMAGSKCKTAFRLARRGRRSRSVGTVRTKNTGILRNLRHGCQLRRYYRIRHTKSNKREDTKLARTTNLPTLPLA